MTLQLDDRRLAILEDMGIRGFLPAQARIATQPVAASVAVHAPVVAAPAAVPTAVPAAAPRPAAPASARVEMPALQSLDWQALQGAVVACTACGLCDGRHGALFGVGDPRADWMVVGDPPGEEEDAQGEPFAGQAGQLLDSMLAAVARKRGKGVFITNVLKCAPPGQRNPDAAELAQCENFLRRQVALIQPRVILAMGRFAVQALLQTSEPIGKLRGSVHAYQGVPVVVTYHPAYLLRNLPDKGKAWADLCMAQAVVTAAGAAA